ncbi:MBL fold metallo-hydrolase [Desulfococcus sp.]|uniref:MBL fold metallo-hydrolase n=1 Tax=Desulfococcus sp. TaxID=2025834 RepID=UPI0035943B9E
MRLTDHIHIFPWESETVNNCNTYLIGGASPILIDPGHLALFEHVQRGLLDMGLSVGAVGLVVCTHGHPDHIEGAMVFRELGVPMALHEAEWRFLPEYQEMSELRMDAAKPDLFIEEGPFSWGGHAFEVFHTPGHTPGSVSLYWPREKALFTGDLVFKEGLGRTDLPGGDGGLLKAGIRRLATLDVEWLLPGHGEVISGADAVRKNFEEMESFWFAYV